MNNSGKKGFSLLTKKAITISLLLVVVLVFASCASASKTAPAVNQAGYAESASYYSSAEAPQAASPDDYEYAGGGLGESADYNDISSAKNIMSQRKMIMEGNVSLETLDFDESINAMDQLVKDFGGFAETRNVMGKGQNSRALRYASYIIRVPAESFELVLKSMGSIGTVLESSSQGTDITEQYYDAETRIKTLKVQEDTLLDILAKSTKLEDVITLEKRISEVRYEIERLENTIKNYDRLVAFSRISVHIQEVDDRTETKPIPVTLSERASRTFTQSIDNFRRNFENFLIWLIYSWIDIIILLVIVEFVAHN